MDGNSSESKGYNDYEEESTSNKVTVMLLGGNEHMNTPASIMEEQYESDQLEEEKTDGKVIYFKGKPKNEQMHTISPINSAVPSLDGN
mgnify:CR=1 FL=1